MKHFFTSKKAWVMMMGVAGLVTSAATGVIPPGQAVLGSLGLFGAYMVSQGVADIGKEKK